MLSGASSHVVASNGIASPLRSKSILITGGAGFIGSSLAEKLVEHNRVILFDQSFECGPIQHTTLLRHPNVTSVRGSILEADLRSLVKDVDVVVHAAAILGVNRVCSSARETLETNYVGTSRLLKALDATRKIQRFVYFSTSEVFGVNSYRVDRDEPANHRTNSRVALELLRCQNSPVNIWSPHTFGKRVCRSQL